MLAHIATGLPNSININRCLRHFVEMVRRGESGTSALTGQTWPDVADAVFRFHRTQAQGKRTILCLLQPRFHGERTGLMLVLASENKA